jgi:hypothetical protein
LVRKVVTYCECDACPHWELVDSPKSFLRGFREAPYPPGWEFIKFGKDAQGDWLCPKCARGAQQAYSKYKQERQKQMEKKNKNK